MRAILKAIRAGVGLGSRIETNLPSVYLTVHDTTTHGKMFLAFPSVQGPGNESMIDVCDNIHCTNTVLCEKFSSVDIKLNDGLSPSTT